MGSFVRAAMRSLARLALALTLLLGASLAATAAAQDDGVSFSSTCQQLRCFFELDETPAAIEGNVTEVEWTFGPNGTNETGNPVRHTFPSPGTYDVSVQVTGEGENATRVNGTGEVTVSEGEVPWSAVAFGAVALVASIGLARAT